MSPPYPILPDAEEKESLDKWLLIVRSNEAKAEDNWKGICDKISSRSRTQISVRSFGEGVWDNKDAVFKPLKDHIIKAVLLVATRFGWSPEEILALWQIEGLPCWTGNTSQCQENKETEDKEGWSNKWLLFSDWDLIPENQEEALSFARSIVLWDRWGLDVLVPTARRTYIHTKTGKKKQDIIVDTRKKKKDHDDKFQEGFEKEIRPILKESPFEYLTSPGPFGLGRLFDKHWLFRTHSDYQASVLAMQYARFKYLESMIQANYGERQIGKKARLSLKPPFPALVRAFYNCREQKARDTIIRAVEDLVREDLRRVGGSSERIYKRDDLQRLFAEQPIPKRIRRYLRTDRRGERYYVGVGVCYIGGLRYEILRQTYKILFNGIR